MKAIDLTQDVRDGMLKALSDIGNFSLDDEEINSIIKDTINYLNEGDE